jgi:hypothetical protein
MLVHFGQGFLFGVTITFLKDFDELFTLAELIVIVFLLPLADSAVKFSPLDANNIISHCVSPAWASELLFFRVSRTARCENSNDAQAAVRHVEANLAAQQDKYAGCNGKDRHNHAQASDCRDKCCQSRENEPDAQQQKADIFCEFHGDNPFLLMFMR